MLHLLRLFLRVMVMMVHIEIQVKSPNILPIHLYCNLVTLWLVQWTWCFCLGVELYLLPQSRGRVSPFPSSPSGEPFNTASSGLFARPVQFTNFWILNSFGFSEQKLRFDSFRFFSTIKNHIRYQFGWDPTQLQFTTAKVQLNSPFIGHNQQLWS